LYDFGQVVRIPLYLGFYVPQLIPTLHRLL